MKKRASTFVDNMATSGLELLEASVREHTEGYFNTVNFIETKVLVDGREHALNLDLRDMMLICAISGRNVLISGRTGGGKTAFSRAFAKSLFGNSFGFLQVDKTLDRDTFRDIAFSDIKDGNRLSDAARPATALMAPITIFDEYNRAPAVITNMLQGWLTNGVVILEGGREVRPGVELGNGKKYQFKIATMNEGRAYSGTSEVDRASRDRFAVELPFDFFPLAQEDKYNLITRGNFLENGPAYRKDIADRLYDAHRQTDSVPVNPAAAYFSLAIMSKDNCYRSPEGTKLSFEPFRPEICEGCKASFDSTCGSIFAPSERAMADLMALSKTTAMYRAYKLQGSDPEVTINDVLVIAPFVLYNKLGMAEGWIHQRGGGINGAAGSRWEATSSTIKGMAKSWMDGYKGVAELLAKKASGDTLSDNQVDKLNEAFLKRPLLGAARDMQGLYRDLRQAKQVAKG